MTLQSYFIGKPYNFRALHIGESAMAEQLHRLSEDFGVQLADLYLAQQTHSTHVRDINQSSSETFLGAQLLQDTDGLITNRPYQALLIKSADCTPIQLFDPVRRVLACLHSGWRGTAGQIGRVAVQKMVDQYGCDPSSIQAVIGPSIAQADYQVGPEVYQAFEAFSIRDRFFKPDQDRYLLDLNEANRQILLECGLVPENIQVIAESTFQQPNYHSARRDGSDYGLNGTLVWFED